MASRGSRVSRDELGTRLGGGCDDHEVDERRGWCHEGSLDRNSVAKCHPSAWVHVSLAALAGRVSAACCRFPRLRCRPALWRFLDVPLRTGPRWRPARTETPDGDMAAPGQQSLLRSGTGAARQLTESVYRREAGPSSMRNEGHPHGPASDWTEPSIGGHRRGSRRAPTRLPAGLTDWSHIWRILSRGNRTATQNGLR